MAAEQGTPNQEQTPQPAGQAAPPSGQAVTPQDQGSTVQTSPPWGMFVALAALILVSIGTIWVLASYKSVFTNPTDITSVLGSWFTVVGTVVGAYFGIKVSSDATDKSQSAIQKANNTANRALAALPPETAAEVLRGPTTRGAATMQ
jgi:hypothetical protein